MKEEYSGKQKDIFVDCYNIEINFKLPKLHWDIIVLLGQAGRGKCTLLSGLFECFRLL